MPNSARDRQNQTIRRNEVEQTSLFARDSISNYTHLSFDAFCRHIIAHATEGAEFASLVSEQTSHTRALKESYQQIAENAARLETTKAAPEVESSLRLLLVRDLLAATEQEKTFHKTVVMPSNASDRLKKTALIIGGGLAAGLGIGLVGNALIDLAETAVNGVHTAVNSIDATAQALHHSGSWGSTTTFETTTSTTLNGITTTDIERYVLPSLPHGTGFPALDSGILGNGTSILPSTITGNITLTPYGADGTLSEHSFNLSANQFNRMFGGGSFAAPTVTTTPAAYGDINTAATAAIGGVTGAAITVPPAIQGHRSDRAYAESLSEVVPVSQVDGKLSQLVQTESFKQALALYHKPLIEGASSEQALQAQATNQR